MTYSVTVYYLITNAKQVPEQWQALKSALQFYNFHVVLYSIGHAFEQFRIAVLVLSPSTFLCTPSSSLAGQHKLKYSSVQHCSVTLKHLCATNTFFFLKTETSNCSRHYEENKLCQN